MLIMQTFVFTFLSTYVYVHLPLYGDLLGKKATLRKEDF